MMHLRTRFLIAMGLPALACTKDKPPAETITLPPASASVTATASATASVTATVTASATASETASAVPTVPPLGLGRTGGGGCGFTIACENAPATAPKAAAPKPYEKCSATIAADMNGNPAHGEGLFDQDQTKDRRGKQPNLCCYKAPRALCGGGRPLRSDDGFVVARATPRADWTLAMSPAEPDRERADRFLFDAAAEHASVASFARVSLQLLALGAPPSLVADAHRAALDEIEHARICYALAHRRGAPAMGPGALAIDRAPLDTSLASFVKDTFLDGCVAETMAALDVRTRSYEGDETENHALAKIAEDEERHAELAWRMLAWAIREDVATKQTLAAELANLCENDDVIREIVLPCAKALLA